MGQSIGDGFRADSGFVSQTDFDLLDASFGYSWKGRPGAFVSEVNAQVNMGHLVTNETNELLSRIRSVALDTTLPLHTRIGVSFSSNEQVFAGSAFDLSELSIDFSTRPVRGINDLARFTGGNQIDFANVQRGDQLSFSHFLGYNITQHLLVNLSQTFQVLDVPGGELFRTVLTDLRFSYLISRASFFRISLIHQATRRNSELYEFAIDKRSDSVEAELLYSYKLNPQTVFFLGYTTSGIENERLSGLGKTSDNVFVKLSYAWIQ